MATSTCPRCGERLSPFTYDMVELDICASCSGVWFQSGELKALIDRDPEGLDELDDELAPQRREGQSRADGPPACPDCDTELTSYVYAYTSGIQLDECAECGGVWVDDRELAAIESYRAWANDPAVRKDEETAAKVASEDVVGLAGWMTNDCEARSLRTRAAALGGRKRFIKQRYPEAAEERDRALLELRAALRSAAAKADSPRLDKAMGGVAEEIADHGGAAKRLDALNYLCSLMRMRFRWYV